MNVTSVTTTIVKYQMLLLYSSKGNFFHKVLQQTVRPIDQTNEQITDQPTNN